MILIKIKLDRSEIHGLGCFAREFVKKGQLVWRFDENFDVAFKKEYVDKLPEATKENFLNYIYISKTTGDYILCSDDSRFFNHDDNPNVSCVIPEGAKNNELVCFATRDINEGEELTNDYRDFDAESAEGLVPYVH